MHHTTIEPNHWYSDRDLAIHFSIGRSTVWLWTRNGILPKPKKLTDRTSRWLGSDILKFEEQKTNGGNQS